jgi:hypothetical protein
MNWFACTQVAAVGNDVVRLSKQTDKIASDTRMTLEGVDAAREDLRRYVESAVSLCEKGSSVRECKREPYDVFPSLSLSHVLPPPQRVYLGQPTSEHEVTH